MTKAAIDVSPILNDFYFSRQKNDGDFARFGFVRFKGCDVTVDDGVTAGRTHIETLRRRINPVELDLKLVMTDGENAKLVLVQTVNPVYLGRRYDLFAGCLWLGR